MRHLTARVVVVGGGPSGASCAHTIAQAGTPVVLVEKEEPPREKLCGGGLTQKTLRFLQARRLLDRSLIQSECYEIETVFTGGNTVSVASDEPIVSVVHRRDFDKSLLDSAREAGAEVATNERFLEVEFSKPLRVHTNRRTIHADYIIGADGINSAVAKSAGMWKIWPTQSTALGLECDVPVRDFDKRKVRVWFDNFGGYLWEFPRADSLDVGIIGVKDDSTLRERILKFMQAKGYSGRIKGWHLPVAGLGNTPTVARKRTLLVGDACGAVDPWFGEGIYYALMTGEAAGKSVTSNPSPEVAYQKEYAKFWNDMKWAHKFAKFFYGHETFIQLTLSGDKKTHSHLIQLLAGERSFKNLFINSSLRSPYSAAKLLLNQA